MSPLKPTAFALSLAISLTVLSALCWLAIVLLPQVQLAHSWLSLFTAAPVETVRAGATAIAVSFAAGWLTAFVMAVSYNRLIKTGV